MKNLLLWLLLPCAAFSQQMVSTPDGKKVLLNEDGTWKYVTEAAPINTEKPAPLPCDSLIKTTKDKMTGTSSTSAAKPFVFSRDNKEGIVLTILGGKTTILLFKAFGAGSCVSEGEEVNILFTDGERMTLKHCGKFNCDAQNTVYFGGLWGKKKELATLGQKQIETVRVWIGGEYVQENVAEEDRENLMRTFSCLSAQ